VLSSERSVRDILAHVTAFGARLEGNIAAALVKADFRKESRGEDSPPVTHYKLGNEDQGFFVEFLAPLRGSGTRRDGTPAVTTSMAGVNVQKLRHVELLLIQPWTVSLDARGTEALTTPAEVRLASPVTSIAQKLLIRNLRPPEKQAQDVLYIHDTLELFASDLESLKTEWRDRIRPMLTKSKAGSIERLSREQFGAVTEVIRAAARIPADRTLAPDRLQRACLYGLEEIFGGE